MSERKKQKITPLIKRVEQIIRITGYDENLIEALAYHLNVLKDSKDSENIETRMEMLNYVFSKMFIDKYVYGQFLYPTQRFRCQIDENSAWPLKPLPSELFGEDKLDDTKRKRWFYNTLNVGDILECSVSSILPTEYYLRIIHKHGVTRILDDLNLMVVLCCIKNEMKVLEKELLVYEYVRVAVTKIDRGNVEVKREEDEEVEFKVYVTVDKESITSFKSLPKLGRISRSDIRNYDLELPDAEKYTTYSDYINTKPQFQNPLYYDEILEGFGINPRKIYSFYPEFNEKECIDSLSGMSLLKESKSEDAKSLGNISLKKLQHKKYDDSLKYIKEAINICPEDDMLRSRLYEIKADIHAEMAKPGLSFEAAKDLETAYKLNSDDENIKKKLSEILFKCACFYYHKKDYKNTAAILENVLKVDQNHEKASLNLNRLKKKLTDDVTHLEDKSLLDLQAKKKKLLTELEKIK